MRALVRQQNAHSHANSNVTSWAFHVLQVRLKCLHALLTLLKAVTEDTQATKEFQAVAVLPGMSGTVGSLQLLISSCLAEVKSQDPASAHKSLAEEAERVLAKCVKQ